MICANRPDKAGLPVCVTPEGSCRRFCPPGGPRCSIRTAPPPPPNDEVRHIGLTGGRFAVVDVADYEQLSKYRWSWLKTHGANGYARRCEGNKTILMHRQILKAPKGMMVDHIDGNGLNNRRSNLRLCTPQQNQCNRCVSRARQKQGLFKGVHHRTDSGKPCARITHRGKTLCLGVFDTDVEAAKAYDRKAIELHGEFAYLNFPEDYGRPASGS